jgi:4-aminobutyrate aminotransferase-like enzyme
MSAAEPAARHALLSTGLNAGQSPLVRVVGGEGVHLILEDGRRVIDASNTGGPLGHAHPELVAAVRAAATGPVINEGWAWLERETAAQELIDQAFEAERDWVGSVRFFLSGSEANDAALSLAQAYTGRTALATRERAYHGMTGLAREMTVQPHWHGGLSFRDGGTRPAPRTVDVRQLPRPTKSRIGQLPPDADAAGSSLDRAGDSLEGVAAVITDYTQGGTYFSAEHQDAVAAAARGAGALWIADEVVTGLGRSGRWFAFQGGESRPDIVTLGKPLTGGAAPGGAVVLSHALTERLEGSSWQTYSTFRGHPLTVAAIRAHLAVAVRDRLPDRAAQLDSVFFERLADIAARHPSVRRADGRGLHWTIELEGPDWRSWHADTDELPIASRVAARALEADVLIGTSGEQTSLFLAPPLIISDSEVDRLMTGLDHGLRVADESMSEAR